MPPFEGSSRLRDRTHVSSPALAGRFFTTVATWDQPAFMGLVEREDEVGFHWIRDGMKQTGRTAASLEEVGLVRIPFSAGRAASVQPVLGGEAEERP